MRLNKFIAQATGMSRRKADDVILSQRVRVNDLPILPGQQVGDTDSVTLDGKPLKITAKTCTMLLHKPVGYVVSRQGQGSLTIYDLLPTEFHSLKPVGRLDKNSSGLLILTNDGQLAQQLTHPSYAKKKVYEVTLDKPLAPLHQQMIQDNGIMLDDGLSRLLLQPLSDSRLEWQITMSEGRNRQVRRTFDALGYRVVYLHRIRFGTYSLGEINIGAYRIIHP